MLTLDRISRFHGSTPILVEVTLGVPPGARIGVVGPNGVGKSTLLRIAAGLEEPDSGTVAKAPPELTVGYMPQEAEALPGETLLEYLLRRAGGGGSEWDVAAGAAAACSEAGLRPELLDRRVEQFSGGQAGRAALASILVSRFDVLLLDEPTNDLDFEGLDRLERFVESSSAAMLVVSHDRDFLDRTVTRVLELDEWTHTAREYAGGWSEYRAAREREREEQYRRYAEAQERRADIEALLRARRTQAGRAGSRVLARETGGADRRGTHALRSKVRQAEQALERLEDVPKPYEPWDLRLDLAHEQRAGKVVARLEGAVVERGSFRLGPVDLELGRGERVALIGPNGSGKTTLIRALLGELSLTAGSRYLGPGVVVGELDQQRELFDSGERLLETFTSNSLLLGEEARTLLAKFGLGADDVLRAGSSLSPGERTRAEVALLATRGVNLLVLDEPTNHLDLPAIEELEAAVGAYEGTILLVTHDRSFLEAFGPTRTVSLP
jgi:ATPase subunit of ABC transporter with duplicated ATPase domains